MSEWLNFIEMEQKAKTRVYAVVAKVSGDILGKIKWYGSWRHYCFFPTIANETVHSDRCLMTISQFITKLNEEHKNKKAQQ